MRQKVYNWFNNLRNQFGSTFSFIKELGGLKVFFTKTIWFIKENGFKKGFTKASYIFSQLRISGLHFAASNNAKEERALTYKIEKNDLEALKNLIKTFKHKPTISIVMPTYNSNPEWLKKAIESVRSQIYSNWELCIADDASTEVETKLILKDYQKRDKRIKIVFRKKNGHISAASNSALKLVTGDYVALLDHDDKLSTDALFWVVKTINENPNAKLIYSDEDKIDGEEKRKNPYFKCDWNYSLFLSQNMINHLGIYKTEVLKKINGFRVGFEGSQDYDLILRFIEQISDDEIIHIPRVLYHWRIHEQSTALKSDKKPYATIAAQRAISEHLNRKGVSASVEVLPFQMYRVRYHLNQVSSLVSIIIPFRNSLKSLKRCVDSILSKTDYKNYEILIIVDNSTDKQTLEYLEKLGFQKNIHLISEKQNFNFSAINNRAVEKAKGDYICFVSDETEIISKEWLTEMISVILQKDVGVVGAKLYYPDNTIQHAGIILGLRGVAGNSHKHFPRSSYGYFFRAVIRQEFSAVTSACMLVSKTIFKEVRGFNEKDLKIAFNDIDLCLKIREAGYKIVWTPFAKLYNYESASGGNDMVEDKRNCFINEINYMKKKWKKWIENDPAYSPNLTLDREDFSQAFPSRIDKIV